MEDVWTSIVATALRRAFESSQSAIPGAKFRETIAKVAKEQQLDFPPKGHESEKFGDFLKRFSSLLVVLRREGQDVLIAPADMPDLLDRGDESVQLRSDIFEAFTHIPRGSPSRNPWYVRDSDIVEWLSEDEIAEGSKVVRIPQASMEQELNDRRAFATSAEVHSEIQLKLLDTLQAHSALTAYSNEIKNHGLSRKWHFFRFRRIVDRIRAWCKAADVPWRDEWIVSQNRSLHPKLVGATATTGDPRESFERFISALSDEDLRRISVPLDIVLKAIHK